MMSKNEDRSNQTRARLVAAARELFAERGYAATATEAILAGARVQRGAMYHHYENKAALFEAVCLELAAEAGLAIEAAVGRIKDPYKALEAGAIAWIEFMTQPEVRQILILDAPTVLGWKRWNALDEQHGFAMLKEGVREALDAGSIQFAGDAEMLAVMLNGVFNAMALRAAETNVDWRTSVVALLRLLRRKR